MLLLLLAHKLVLLYSWKSDPGTLYWFAFFGSSVIIASVIFYGVTSEGFERWRESMVEKFDRSRIGRHMQRASSAFAPKKKNRDTGGR